MRLNLKYKNILFFCVHFFIFLIIGLIVYYPSLKGNFMWDDISQIVENIYITSLKNIPIFFTKSTFYIEGYGLIGTHYRPLMMLSYALMYHIFGAIPFYFHIIQLFLHIINSFLYYKLLSRLFIFDKPNIFGIHIISFVLAIIFLIHPLNTEIVTYIANFQESLFFFFGISSLYILVMKKSSYSSLLISLFLVFLSLLSKETGMLFISIILLYLYIYHRKKIYFYLGGGLFVLITYFILRCYVANLCFIGNYPNRIHTLPFISYLIQVPALLFFYIKSFILPIHLAIGQQWIIHSINFNNFYAPLIVDVSFFLLLTYFFLFIFYKKSRSKVYTQQGNLYVFFSFWFLTGLLFHIHLVPLELTVADRWFYLPMAGLLGMLGVSYSVIFYRYKKLFFFMIICILLILSIRTFYRSYDWQDSLKLYEKDNTRNPSFETEYLLGRELFSRNNFSDAQIHLERSIKLGLSNYALEYLALIHERNGNYSQAEYYYKLSVKNFIFYTTYKQYVENLIHQKKYKEAKEFVHTKVLKTYPNNQFFNDILQFLDHKI